MVNESVDVPGLEEAEEMTPPGDGLYDSVDEEGNEAKVSLCEKDTTGIIPEKPSELFKAMCTGLEYALSHHRDYEVDMETYGSIRRFHRPRGSAPGKPLDDPICMGCAATFTILERMGFRELLPSTVRGFIKTHYEELKIKTAASLINGMTVEKIRQLRKMELMINNLRLGSFTQMAEYYGEHDVFRELNADLDFVAVSCPETDNETKNFVGHFRDKVIPVLEEKGL